MKTFLLAAAIVVLTSSAIAQDTAVDKYLSDAGTIIIAKCLAVGPVNILLRADARVQILYVVKGKETRRELMVNSQYGMSAGETYLLRTKGRPSEREKYFEIDTRDSVIPFTESDKLDELKALPTRILILRTMNLRADRLEAQIRSLKHELDALDSIRKNN